MTRSTVDHGRMNMTEASRHEEHHEDAPLGTRDDFALRIFTITMAGICGVILLMILMGHY